jgi:hypothetical protein
MTVVIDSPTTTSDYEAHYDPAKVLTHKSFRVLSAGSPELQDKTANIACAYTPDHQVQLLQKPLFPPRAGEVVVHVRATGICGYVYSFSSQADGLQVGCAFLEARAYWADHGG